MYTAPYGKQTARGNSLHDSGASNPGLCGSLEGWEGVGSEGEGQRGGDTRISAADSCRCTADDSWEGLISELAVITAPSSWGDKCPLLSGGLGPSIRASPKLTNQISNLPFFGRKQMGPR